MTRTAVAALAALLAGCEAPPQQGGNAAAPAANEAAPAANQAAVAGNEAAGAAQEKVLKSETVEAVFTGWDRGDYVWARLKVKGREEIGAWSGPSPIDLFLDAHVGKTLTVTLDTIMADVPEAGGKLELQRISAARLGALTAQAWWDGLTPKQRQDAQIGLAGSLEPAPPPIEQ